MSLLLVSTLVAAWCRVGTAGTTGKLAGEVRDKETKEPVPGVNVVLEGTTTGGVTDVNGKYYILLIAPGTYSISASILGYQTVKVTNVKVNVDLTTTVNFEMSQEALQIGDKIEIVAERPLIQKDGVTTMQVTEAEVVENMVADDFKDVLTLNSGVTTTQIRDDLFSETAETGEGLFYIRGSRGNELAFMVDGLYVRDAFSGGLGTEIANTAIEELQLISGNFNAEYGNAMSGVLNLITQEGGSKTGFRLRGFTDTFFGKGSSEYTFLERDALIKNKGRLEATNWGTSQTQFSLSGPLPGLKDKVKYFVSGEYFETDGYIGVLQGEIARRGTAKLTLSPSKKIKLNVSANANNEDFQIYEHAFAHDGVGDLIDAPAGSPPNNLSGNDRITTRTLQNSLSWTHTLSAKAFYELKVQRFSRDFFDRVSSRLEEYNDNPITYNAREDFVISGFQTRFIDQEDRVLQAKLDLTYQVNLNHNLKAGLDIAKHRVWRHQVLPTGDIANIRDDHYLFRPLEAAAYIQDKMEFDDLVINVGLRVDRFEPRDSVLVDFNRPLGQRKIASDKTTVSPRFGIAHPVTERSSLHFSYGHFYQVPEYDKLVFNSQRQIEIFRPTLGNADLKPQKTIAFEVGWDQQLTDYLALTVTGFYKDIENLVSTDRYPVGVTYFINQDFANSRGLELNLRTRRANHLATYFSYTLARAEGNSSNPLDSRDALLDRPPRVPVKRLILLAWDRAHVFNFNLDFRYAKNEGPRFGGSPWLENFGVNLTGRFESGVPYTPTDSRGQRPAGVIENSARIPSTWQLDLRADKIFDIAKLKVGVFTEITNLTNHRNVVAVFTDTGLPNDTRNPNFTELGKRDPYNIGPQRNFRLGAEIIF
jgi:outer membrane receptor protein involved in Fe transport